MKKSLPTTFETLSTAVLGLFLLNGGYLLSFSEPTLSFVATTLIPVLGGWVALAAALLLWRQACQTGLQKRLFVFQQAD